DKTELTARAIRKIADKALRDIFSHLKRDRFGRHMLNRRGAGGDPTDESKTYEFGDPFLLDLKETVMNAVERTGQGTPVRLVPDDFAVYRTEFSTQSATVVMLDLSRSMIYNGCFLPAKKVALALNALIAGQFPRDQLHIIGFSLYAREFKADQIPGLNPSETSIGTNMQAGFQLPRPRLLRHPRAPGRVRPRGLRRQQAPRRFLARRAIVGDLRPAPEPLVGRNPRGGRYQLRGRRRQDAGAARALGLRQVHHPPPHCRSRSGHERAHPDRRGECDAPAP